jgi:hypothetical protein
MRIGDDRLSAGEHKALARELVQTRYCTLPPGHARNLRATVEKMFPNQYTTQVEHVIRMAPTLTLLAWTHLISIACLERTHALNRRFCLLSRLGFHTMAAASLIAQKMEDWRGRQRNVAEKEGAAKLLAVGTTLPGASSVILPRSSDRYRPLVGRSPFQVFVDRRMAFYGSRLVNDTMFNRVKHVKFLQEEYDEAPLDEIMMCSSISESSFLIAKVERTKLVEGGERFSEVISVPRADYSAADGVLQNMTVCDSSRGMQPKTADGVASGSDDRDSDMPFPWTEETLKAFTRGEGVFEPCGKHAKRHAAAEMRQRCRPCGTGILPMPQYSIRCGALCQHVDHPSLWVYQRAMKQKLMVLVAQQSPSGKVALITGVDVIMAFEFPGTNNPPEFYRVEDAKAKHGRHAAHQEFCSLRPVGPGIGNPWHGLCLESVREIFVAPRLALPSPLDFASVGDLRVITDDVLTGRLAQYDPVIAYTLQTKSSFTPRSFDSWEVEGVRNSITMTRLEGAMPSDDVAGDVAGGSEDEIGFGVGAPAFDRIGADDDDEVPGGGDAPMGDPSHLDRLRRELEIMFELPLGEWDAEAIAFFQEAAEDEEQTRLQMAAEFEEEGKDGEKESSMLELNIDPDKMTCVMPLPRALAAADASHVLGVGDLGGDMLHAITSGYALALQLVPRRVAGPTMLFRFADEDAQGDDVLLIHTVMRPDTGVISLKATCKRNTHGHCLLWITKPVLTLEDYKRIVLSYLQWAADGRRSTENEHWCQSRIIRRNAGMVVR